MSTCWWLGQSSAAPATTTTPIATNSPTTILAGSGPSGDGPDDKLCECEWVTRSTVEAAKTRLLSVAGQEVAQPVDRARQITGPGQRHDAQVIRRRPVESGALGDQDLLLQQQVEDELLVVVDVVDLGIQPRKGVERTVGLDAGHAWNLVELRPGDVALLQQPASRKHQVVEALVTAQGDLDRMLGRDIWAQPHIGQQVDPLNEAAGVVLGSGDR